MSLTRTPAPQRPRRRWWPRSGKVQFGLVVAILYVLLAIVGPWVAPYEPTATSREVMQPPSPTHWMGTTQLGEDVFSQFLAGARISLLVGVTAAFFSKVISLIVGVLGGYFRGVADEILYILTAVFLVIPGMPLLIVLTGYLPSRGAIAVAFVIALTSWAGSARVLRAQTMSLRNRDFVEAARATGESRWRIILAEIVPNELPLIASGFLFMIIAGVMAEAGLSFLGLGSLTSVSWGTMLYFAQSSQAFLYGAWWWFIPPGLAIAFLGAALALINFGIDEYSNPRLRTGSKAFRTPPRSRVAVAAVTSDGATVSGESLGEGARAEDASKLDACVEAPVEKSVTAPDVAPVIGPSGASSDEVVIECEHLFVEYPGDGGVVQAVKDVSLQLHRGEVLGLAGESGSGKTTLTNSMIRLLRPPAKVTGGTVTYHRRDRRGKSKDAEAKSIQVLDLTPEQLRAFRWSEIACVFQSAMNALNPVITIGAQFDDVLRVHRPGMSRAKRTARARAMLEKVGIDPDRIRSYPHELSGGMKQRVAIALALVLEPDIIIMDEPTTALDLLVQREVLRQIMELRDEYGFAIIFTTHDLALLLEISDSIAVMHRGVMVEYGSAEAIYRNAGHPYTRKLLDSLAQMGENL